VTRSTGVARGIGRGHGASCEGLDTRQDRVRGVVDRVMVVDYAVGACEHELHLARIVAP
jgi:hypothetical protein